MAKWRRGNLVHSLDPLPTAQPRDPKNIPANDFQSKAPGRRGSPMVRLGSLWSQGFRITELLDKDPERVPVTRGALRLGSDETRSEGVARRGLLAYCGGGDLTPPPLPPRAPLPLPSLPRTPPRPPLPPQQQQQQQPHPRRQRNHGGAGCRVRGRRT